MRTVLVANRGEIALRVIRACRDSGLRSVAVYASPDRGAPFVRLADGAVPLAGSTVVDTYLSAAALLDAASRSGADAVHPGYGFLSESADFAQAVTDAGLTWIGPPPAAIRVLGNKITARRIAAQVGAPLVPGSANPVSGVSEVEAFAGEHGLPVAIKAAFGGGGRGMKVARNWDEIAELYESAVREATAAFGRGECFVERYIARPRHVEAQVLADAHGNVVVAGTRDCTLQRRFQKLVEEAPAPFLSDEQRTVIAEAARAVCRAAGYQGAGTVEFLIDEEGRVFFLEVNTRIQVEHPVTEETTGLDLVIEQFRVARGLPLSVTSDPQARGHSLEFRINGEDPVRGFLPAPGTVTAFRVPSGPGVRLDAGVEVGSVVGGQYDSLLAKLVVTGADRAQALSRARRALHEFEVKGLPTVLPFHRSVVDDPAFAAESADEFTVHTRWIETDWAVSPGPDAGEPVAGGRQVAFVKIGGRPMQVSLAAGAIVADSSAGGGGAPSIAGRGEAVTAPMQGSVISVAVADEDPVRVGDVLIVMEAMKMENLITAHRDGIVKGLSAVVGQSLPAGTVLCLIVSPPAV